MDRKHSRPAILGLVCLSALLMTGARVPTERGRTPSFSLDQRSYWALVPVRRPTPPSVRDQGWVRSPVDAFILSKLEDKNLHPAAGADKATLLRRVSLDLTGLPPTPEEVDAFTADQSPDAYERVVDRLLASPHYGERWARHWLDLARYAESNGFKFDETRPNAWRYRDYVIQSLNANKPYDQFVKEQIAGDELWPGDPQARIATAFLRHYADESEARNLMLRRQEILNDMTDVTAATFLGLTYGCARCHDHKFDPIKQVDYYRLQAFFANTAFEDHIPLASPTQIAAYEVRRASYESETAHARQGVGELLGARRERAVRLLIKKYPDEVQTALAKAPDVRTPFEQHLVHQVGPHLQDEEKEALKGLKPAERKRYQVLQTALQRNQPGALPEGTGVTDLGPTAPPTYLLGAGAYDIQLDEVRPGFLSILDVRTAEITRPASGRSTGRRTALANWLASPRNPLTARVMANRIWQNHFGQGIVTTPSDFGKMGQRPTHPELLDWLAAEFVDNGWDMKKLHRLIVTSSTYRQSSVASKEAMEEDGRNKLLSRFPRVRLEGETIRDAALATAGLLNRSVGGPSVFPELPEGVETPRGGWRTSSPADQYRRSIYIFVRRNARFPMMEVFDMPDTHESCGRRNRTTTAPQALTLLNDKASLRWATALAGRVVGKAGAETDAQIVTAYRYAFGRTPDAEEMRTAKTFLDEQRTIISARLARREPIAQPSRMAAHMDKADGAALVDLCQMLLNTNEFVYRN